MEWSAALRLTEYIFFTKMAQQILYNTLPSGFRAQQAYGLKDFILALETLGLVWLEIFSIVV